MASDIDATIAFWRDGFGGQVVGDVDFAGARNVFMRIGEGRLHLYAQPPRTKGRATVHHLGVQTDEIDAVVAVEIFQPDLDSLEPALREYFDPAS